MFAAAHELQTHLNSCGLVPIAGAGFVVLRALNPLRVATSFSNKARSGKALTLTEISEHPRYFGGFGRGVRYEPASA